MKNCVFVCLVLGFAATKVFSQVPPVSVYSFKVPLVNGTDTLNLSGWQGKKILVVNTSSQCANVQQYAQLEQLYQQFKDSGLVILACPSNSFGAEPYSNQQVMNFCSTHYGITYLLSKKISVTCTALVPLYEWLTQKTKNGVMDPEIRTDFTKFLINGQGQLVGFFDGSIGPLDAKVLNAIRAN